MEASEGQRPRNPLAKTLSWVCSGSSRSRQRGKGETGKVLAPEVGTSGLNAKRSIVDSSPSKLPQARKMKDESHIWGREDFAKELVSQLIDENGECANLRVISVVGEEAIGKTALVRSICNRAEVKNHFDCCAWVRFGPEPNLVHLMLDLVKQLRGPELQDVDSMDKKKLSEMLLGVLMECRYLIVLDDLCDLHLMDKLIIKVFADSRNGSRVIITIRNTKIPSSIGPWYSEHLELMPLDPEQRNRLLEESSAAFDLKGRILCKSGGSPAKILLLGGLLSTTTLRRCTELVNKLPDKPTVRDIMDLSVNDLPERLKKCALYLALFPKEYEIPIRRLFRLWSAENLVSSALESEAEEYFEILVSRNMVHVARRKLDGSARSCRLPGSLYDVFYQMARNEKFLNIYDCSIHEEGKFDAPRIAIHRDISAGGEAKGQINVPGAGQEQSEIHAQEAHITPAKPHQRMSTEDNSTPYSIQQLCSYVSFNTMKLGTRTGDIVALLKPLVPKRDSSLLVLDLEGVYKPLLPEELDKILPKLKYLGLRWTLLEMLPKSVAQLPCLETLDLKYTNITSLPESILEAKNLRHLHMTNVDLDDSARRLSDPKKSLNYNIQTIWGLAIKHDGGPILEVLGKLTGLMKLALKCAFGLKWEAIKPILNLEMLKSLRLDIDLLSTDEMGDMSKLKSLSNLYLVGTLHEQILLESRIPPNLKVLTLSESELDDDPMGVLGKLKCLTTLRLFAKSYRGQILSVSKGTFPSLRVLKLWQLEKLTTWTIQENAMPCLADLEIKDCKELKTLDELQQIKTLEVITLVGVPDELKRRVRDKHPNVPIVVKREEKLDEEDANEEKDEDDYSE